MNRTVASLHECALPALSVKIDTWRCPTCGTEWCPDSGFWADGIGDWTVKNRTVACFIQSPAGTDGRERVAINIDEIASYRSHEVVSYSYQEWVLVTLKSGKEHDLHITLGEFEKKIKDAYQELES